MPAHRKMRRALSVLCAVTVFLVASSVTPVAYAFTYYVSEVGSDKAGDGSREHPWRSLQRASDNSKPGDHVMVSAGTYRPFHIETPGKPTARILFVASGSGVRIKGYEYFAGRYAAVSVMASYITLEGFEIDVGLDENSNSRGIRVSGVPEDYVKAVQIYNNHVANAGWVGITTSYAEGVVIQGNHVQGSRGQHGIYVANSADHPIIRGNVVFDNAQAGIQVNADPQLPGDGVIEGAIIENNILYRNGHRGSAALNLASVRNSRISGNLLYENASQGLASWDDEAGNRYGCKNNLYLNNTVVMPKGSRHALVFRHGSSGNAVYNNILVHLGERDGLAIDSSSMPGLKSDFNVVSRIEDPEGKLVELSRWREITGLDRHSFAANPDDLFVDHQHHVYELVASSPAIDKGTPRSEVGKDLRGLPRPQGISLDIGAYEHVSR